MAAEFLHHAYDMKSLTTQQRDVNALASARFIQSRISTLSSDDLEKYCELVIKRLLSKEMGGRSFTLGALANLLRPGLKMPLDRSFVTDLSDAAERAMTKGTFLNPEFGLVIAASLCERFGEASDWDLLEYLVSLRSPNGTVSLISSRLRRWLEDRHSPLQRVIKPEWLVAQVVRDLPVNAEIFLKMDEVEAVAALVPSRPPSLVSAEELDAYDQVVRRDASALLDDWLIRA
jgi:hypothetical protein